MARKQNSGAAAAAPGEVVREEFMEPLGLSAKAVARACRIPRTRIDAHCPRGNTASLPTPLALASASSSERRRNSGSISSADLRSRRPLPRSKLRHLADKGARRGRLRRQLDRSPLLG